LSLGLIAAGGMLAYAGVKGYSIPHALQAFVQGKVPTGPADYPISGSGAGSASPGATVTLGPNPDGNAIAADALTYVGRFQYVLGGAPATGSGDCSSFVNLVIGRDAGLPIPGFKAGTYDGTTHGPNSFEWATWSGVAHIKRADTAAGDLLIWSGGIGHIGIAISNSQMVSALDPADGTKVTGIDGTATGFSGTFRLVSASKPSGQQAGARRTG
jgi:cell wall-associated NlpC family hydrolase